MTEPVAMIRDLYNPYGGPEERRSWPGGHPCALCYIQCWHSRAQCSKPAQVSDQAKNATEGER